jgi:hypothetical protein
MIIVCPDGKIASWIAQAAQITASGDSAKICARKQTPAVIQMRGIR